MMRFLLANNPKGGTLWVNPDHVVAVAPAWFNGSRTQVIEPGHCTLHMEGGRYWDVAGDPELVAARVAARSTE